MTTRGRMYSVDSKTAPPPPDPPTPAQRAANDIIGELARHNINLSLQNYCLSTREAVQRLRIAELEAALQGILTTVDSAGLGLTEALRQARAVMRR